jgi:hypothetical protein
MEGNLDTTNMWLAIMAVVSVLEALLLIGMGVGGFLVYRRVTRLVEDLEARQVAPLREKVEGILGDLKAVTSRVSSQTERVDQAIAGTMHRVDDTAERMRSSVKDRVNQAAGVVRGVRAVIMSLLNGKSRPEPPATAAGRL